MAKVKNIEEVVKWVLMEQSGCDESEIVPTAMLTDDLGFDSLDAIETLMAFEEKLDIEIPDEDIDKITTVAECIEYLKEKTA